MNAAKIHSNWDGIDTLGQPTTTDLKGSSLREGMVLVDELGCPVAGLDHRVRTEVAGCIAFLVHDFERGGWRQDHFHANQRFAVVAR